jgi:hypothetical protein
MRIVGVIAVTIALVWHGALTVAAAAEPAANRAETWISVQQISKRIGTSASKGKSCSRKCPNGSSCGTSCDANEKAVCGCGADGDAYCDCEEKKLPRTQKH